MNVVEQDYLFVKERVWLAKGYSSFQSAWRTLQEIETMHMINKGRVRWLAKGDVVGQTQFVASLFGIIASDREGNDGRPFFAPTQNFATEPSWTSTHPDTERPQEDLALRGTRVSGAQGRGPAPVSSA
jgi:hypothetical protein